MRVVRAIAGGILALVTAALALAVTAVLVVFLVDVDWDRARPYVVDAARAYTGREVTLDRFAADIGWETEITVEGLVIPNPPWANADTMLRVPRGHLVLLVKPLLSGRIELDEMRLEQSVLHLEQQADRANWQFGRSSGGDKSDRSSMPVLRRLEVTDGRLTYRGPDAEEPITSHFERLLVRTEGLEQPVSLEMVGQYEKRDFEATLDLGSFRALRAANEPYPVAGRIRAGTLDASYDGTVTDPTSLQGLDGDLTLAGHNLDQLHDLLGLPVPETPPYKLSGRLSKDQETWRVEGLSGEIGETDVQGWFTVEAAKSPAKFSADLTSNQVRLSDLEAFIGRAPDGNATAKKSEAAANEGKEAQSYLIPDQPFNLSKLHGMNVDVSYTGKSVITAGQAINSLAAEIRIEGGVLRLMPLRLGLFQGILSSDATIDATRNPPHVDARFQAEGLRLGTLVKATADADLTEGKFRGHAKLSSDGDSMHELAANADGDGALVMEGGKVSSMVVELVALDLVEALGQYLEDSEDPLPINCALAPFRVKKGRVLADPWLVNTPDSLLAIRGYVDLGDETMKLRIVPHAKDFSLFNAQTGITITGDLTERSVSVNEMEIAAKIALKTLMAPLMPLLSPAMEDEAKMAGSCGELVSRLTNQGQEAAD